LKSEKKSYINEAGLDPKRIPKHLGIIMDGNGRWAQKKSFPRVVGHKAGLDTLKEIVRESSNLGIEVLTVYAFSTENWKRPMEEVNFLMNLLIEYMIKEIKELKSEGVIINIIGEDENVPENVKKVIQTAMEETKENKGMKFNIAFNYGGRAEIVSAIKKISEELLDGKLKVENINEDFLNSKMYTSEDSDPDLIIRTGGEYRLSNFLVWQSAYSELYFTETMWPDFKKNEFRKALKDYSLRNRRFGGLT